ncbi:MAG: hypothetical protein GY851_00455 [bacterium]|nr:hypothetical protein [bacterium]
MRKTCKRCGHIFNAEQDRDFYCGDCAAIVAANKADWHENYGGWGPMVGNGRRRSAHLGVSR